jgi:hypothetical protein
MVQCGGGGATFDSFVARNTGTRGGGGRLQHFDVLQRRRQNILFFNKLTVHVSGDHAAQFRLICNNLALQAHVFS